MNSIEAAASLFDSGDISSDPFALFASKSDADTTPRTDSNEAHAGFVDADAIHEPFVDSIHDSSFFWPQPAAHKSSTQQTSLDVGSGGNSDFGSPQEQYIGSRWQTEPHTLQVGHGGELAQMRTQPYERKSYDPYAAASSSSYETKHPPTISEPAYEAFITPTTFGVPNGPPLSSPMSYSQGAHDGYGHSTSLTHFAEPGTTSYLPTQQLAALAVPPPAPVSTINWPKIANAYDPPLPPPKSRRAVSSRYEYSAPPLSQQQYTSYEMYASSADTLGIPQPIHPTISQATHNLAKPHSYLIPATIPRAYSRHHDSHIDISSNSYRQSVFNENGPHVPSTPHARQQNQTAPGNETRVSDDVISDARAVHSVQGQSEALGDAIHTYPEPENVTEVTHQSDVSELWAGYHQAEDATTEAQRPDILPSRHSREASEIPQDGQPKFDPDLADSQPVLLSARASKFEVTNSSSMSPESYVNHRMPDTSPLSDSKYGVHMSSGHSSSTSPMASVAIGSYSHQERSHPPSIPASQGYSVPPPSVSLPSSYGSGRQLQQGGISQHPNSNPYGVGQSRLAPVPVLRPDFAPTHMPYAPSPSLLGLNDPLGRHLVRIPVISFGFRGKLVSCFHRPSDLNTGFDVALSLRRCTEVHIRVLHKIIPESALDSSAAVYPGPLLMDPANTSTSLVRTSSAAQIKSKKANVAQYLHDRAQELARGMNFLHKGSAERRTAEGKLILVRLLRIMVENDGHLSGTAAIDTAVRAALLPRLAVGIASSQDSSLGSPQPVRELIDAHSSIPDLNNHLYSGLAGMHLTDSHDSPLSVTTLRSSALDTIQNYLVQGERRKAYHFALDQRLWAHAMIIASSIDKDAWKEAATEFLKAELGLRQDLNAQPVSHTVDSGRGPLRVAYSLFSGHGPAAIQELFSPNPPSKPTLAPNIQMLPGQTQPSPGTSSLPPPSFAVHLTPEALAAWPETAAMALISPLTPDASAALTALGDTLSFNQWTEAAHACYLLSPQTSPIGGCGNTAARVALLGARNPHILPNLLKDPDSIVFTEILEFALSLVPISKSQDPFQGLPHLQAYKLLRTASLAELGYNQLANRYCEAISASLGRPSPYFTPTFVEQLEGLTERLSGSPHVDSSGSWIPGKMTKPSLDSIGNWLEGRFTKLITGDGDSSPSMQEDAVVQRNDAYSGPFAHFSTISSATSSASPSPQPSVVNLNTFPLRRSGSAMGGPSAPMLYQIDRANSAMDHLRSKPSTAPPIASASAVMTTFDSHSSSQAANGYHAKTPKLIQELNDSTTPTLDIGKEGYNPPSIPLWGSSYNTESATVTPVAPAFSSNEDAFLPTDSTLLPEDSLTYTPPGSSTQDFARYSHDELEEDLGFGNPKPKVVNGSADHSASPAEESAPQKQADNPKAMQPVAGSWFSRWWKRSDTPAPIKANLGEETTFYYDKELKRWINKSAGSQPGQPVPGPPPSRAQTASPGRSKPPRSDSPSVTQPPLRSASAMDLGTSLPDKSTPRVRSNLVPPSEAECDTPNSSALGLGPPPGRPKSQASKRNLRSRYVDVFQQGP